jgi:NAD(P)-dependent dehydrogenase (short-subunit alcohol dehydrogenase family)
MSTDVVVVIGVGGIGQAIARRQGFGKALFLADFNENTLAAAVKGLEVMGYKVTSQRVDVSSRESVRSLASAAAKLGSVAQVVHTAGLSPNMAPPRRSWRLICSASRSSWRSSAA